MRRGGAGAGFRVRVAPCPGRPPLTVVDEGYVIATVLSILQPPCEGPRPARTQGGVS